MVGGAVQTQDVLKTVYRFGTTGFAHDKLTWNDSPDIGLFLTPKLFCCSRWRVLLIRRLRLPMAAVFLLGIYLDSMPIFSMQTQSQIIGSNGLLCKDNMC